MIINADCINALKDMPENSIHAIVTDPPYGLVSIVKRFGSSKARNTPSMETKNGGVFARKAKGFMGKEWDGSGIENNVFMWGECLRVLKPGGYLLAFSGTRTYHRMASAIEDAGFEIRDMVEWVYGSGFPKSLNIGKAVDKLQGNEKFKEQEIGFVKWLKSNLDCYWCSGLGVISDNEEGFGDPSSCLDCNGKGKHTIEDIDEWLGTKAQAFHFFAESDSNRQIPNAETYKILKNRLHLDNRYDDFVKKHSLLLEEIRELQGYEKSIKNWDKKYDKAILNKPKTELASKWEGWGTALKPAHEPICMARKPLAEKTVAENVLKYGTGGINIDESRVGIDKSDDIYKKDPHTQNTGSKNSSNITLGNLAGYTASQGRFPANLIHDNSEEARECFPNKSDRFFKSISYQAKASKSERGSDNNHPTVKPVKLMEYLISMVTREDQIVLDPFMGSGSTGVACKNIRRQFIGIELDSAYCEIAKKRIEQ